MMSFFKYFFRRFASRSNKSKIKWLRKQGMVIGEKTQLYNGISNYGSEPFLIKIGNNCTVTSNVQFLTHDGGMRVIKNLGLHANPDKFGQIIIGDNVFIGYGSIIMPNVKIGDNVIIGAGSVVTKNVESNSVYCGVPAKKLYSIEEYFKKNYDKIDCTRGLSFKDKKKYLYNKYKLGE